MSAHLRRRGGPTESKTQSSEGLSAESKQRFFAKEECKRLSLYELSFLALCILGLVCIAILPHYYLPEPKKGKQEKEWTFTAEKAREYLHGITNIGHRTVGSYRNDILTVNYLMKEIYAIISHAHVYYNFDVDIQTASGAYSLHFLHKEFTVAYNNITNVIVHMYPKDPKNASEINVMLNAHFDTQPRTEGASDDAVSCAIMLEIMRAISRSPPRTIKHGIVFLFNGAEEGLLDGSHAFVTKHKLAKTIKAFVNLEAAGSGGREVVFQTGPGHPWLIYEYAKSAKYPYASVMAQEIFQSGVIPSDTDFRIFRDFGNLVGIDVAYASNGYVYHTYHDNASVIPDGSIQRGGENIFAVIKSLSKSPYLIHEEEFKKGQMVFFDLLGLTMILYPKRIAVIIDIACVIMTLCYVFLQIIKRKPNLMSFIVTTSAVVVSWIVAIIFALVEAYILTKLGRSLSWYNKPWFAVVLYGIPALIGLILAHHLMRYIAMKLCYEKQNCNNGDLLYERSCVLSHMFILSFFMIYMTYKSLLSTYLLTGYLLFPLISHAVISRMLTSSKADVNFTKYLMGIHFASIAFPTILSTYHLFALFDVFVPIMGRQGSEIPPDLVFAVVSSLCIIIVSLYTISLVHLVENRLFIVKVLSMLSCFAFLLAASGIMFPYSSQNPVAPKRLFMQHVVRNFRNEDGRIVKNDSGIWLVPLDYLGLKPVQHLKSLKSAVQVECDGPYCGFPYFYPLWKLLKKTWYLKGPVPFVQKKKLATFKEIKREKINDNTMRFYYHIIGPDHMNLYITPESNHKLVAWSLTKETPNGQPDYDGKLTFFTYFAHGFYAEPWDFWLEFEIPSNSENDNVIANIALATHFLHGPLSMTKFLQNVIIELPSWVIETCWVSSYDVWKITKTMA